MESFGKEFQDQFKEKAQEGLDKLGEGVDKVKDKAKEVAEKAKEKLTPENILAIKGIVEKIKKVISNLPLDKVPGLDKVLEKLDMIIQELDPQSPEDAKAHVSGLVEIIDTQLVPFIEINASTAKRDLELYVRNLTIALDILLVLDSQVDRL